MSEPRSFLKINGPALRANWRGFSAAVPGVGVLPVLKANAYGHGLPQVVQALTPLVEELPGVVVDQLAEAQIIRAHWPQLPVFCLGWTPPEQYEQVVELEVVQTITGVGEITRLAAAARSLNKVAQVNLELETGLYRLGIVERELPAILDEIKAVQPWVEIVGMSSHFAEAETLTGRSFVEQQQRVFYDAITRSGLNPPFKHIGCTASTILHPPADNTHIRLGISLYGIWPSDDTRREGTLGRRHVELQPVLSFQARLAQIKDVPVGGTVGYSRSFVANRITRIGIIPVGYADGLDRRLTGQTVLVRGARCPIIGRICMNMCMLDLTTAPQTLKAGELVTLLGREASTQITPDDWAQALKTIPYEVVARLSPLLPRILVE